MIPRRVKLRGFLSYKNEQEISFEGPRLWMLAGTNGSGKSTIFDAVTFALFGQHRGGGQQLVELINKSSNDALVEFEFSSDNKRYMIKRTLKRDKHGGAKGTQNAYRWSEEISNWQAIEDTNLAGPLRAWVKDTIGLDYETFTASILLLQGKSEKLLDSTPSGRAEVLAGIVDLERYQKLFEKADAKRKTLKSKLDTLSDQLKLIPEVSPMEFLAAENGVVEAEALVKTLEEEVETLRNLETTAKLYAEASRHAQELQNRLQTYQQILAQSKDLETKYHRWLELKTVAPHFEQISEKESDRREAERKAKELEAARDKAEAKRAQLQRELDAFRMKRNELLKRQTELEQRINQNQRSLTETKSLSTFVRQFQAATTRLEVARKELQRLPTDAEQNYQKIKQQIEARLTLREILPKLEKLAEARSRLIEHRQQEAELLRQEAQIKKAGQIAKEENAQLLKTLEEIKLNRLEAEKNCAQAEALLKQAKQAKQDLLNQEGAKICRFCGQALTPSHIEEEKIRRDRAVKEAGAEHSRLTKIVNNLVREEDEAQTRQTTAQENYERLRTEFAANHSQLKALRSLIERDMADCRSALRELPEKYRLLIALADNEDWTQTTYPTSEDMIRLRAEANDLVHLRRQAEELERTMKMVLQAQTTLESAQNEVDRLQQSLLNLNPEEILQREIDLEAESKTLNESLSAVRKDLNKNEQESLKLQNQLNEVAKEVTEISTRLSAQETIVQQCREVIESVSRNLPESWRTMALSTSLSVKSKFKAELNELQEAGIEAKYRELDAAKNTFQSIQNDWEAAQKKMNQYPKEAQVPVSSITLALNQKRAELKKQTEELSKAREQMKVLETHRQQRADIEAKTKELAHEHKYQEILAKLLGRDYLQRYLVRTAEKQIVELANTMLDRLSDGQLYLKLKGDESSTEKALELEAYNRITQSAPINVAFLSGSQRFRVAVSLAIGIGTYASKQHRPIEAVIIDEGFGCLDRQGRQVMISELQKLRDHMRCILLVSHQEEFADAFPDGYRFELRDGSTQVHRFQR